MIEEIKEVIEKKYSNEISLAIIFGSYVEGKYGDLSDIDIAIKLKNKKDKLDLISSLIIDLSLKLNIKEDKIDIVLLDEDIPIELKFNIIKGKLLYCKDINEYLDIVVRTVSEYNDFKIFLEKHKFKENLIKKLKEEYG